jgi:hypothetical protein
MLMMLSQKLIYQWMGALNELSNVTYSDYLPVDINIETETTISSALPGAPTMSTDVSLLNSVGIEFFQKVGANYYLLNNGNALKIQTSSNRFYRII